MNDEIYRGGLRLIYKILNDITTYGKLKNNAGFVTFIIRDIKNPEGNIDIIGNIPDNIKLQLLEEFINTIKGRKNEN